MGLRFAHQLGHLQEIWIIIQHYTIDLIVDASYTAPQAHGIVNVALHREYPVGIIFIFSQGRKDLYHV
jgi:hypothetical protein